MTDCHTFKIFVPVSENPVVPVPSPVKIYDVDGIMERFQVIDPDTKRLYGYRKIDDVMDDWSPFVPGQVVQGLEIEMGSIGHLSEVLDESLFPEWDEENGHRHNSLLNPIVFVYLVKELEK